MKRAIYLLAYREFWVETLRSKTIKLSKYKRTIQNNPRIIDQKYIRHYIMKQIEIGYEV